MDFLIASVTVVIVTLLGAASPGPDTALILKNSLLGSRKAGLFTALGIVTGNIVYVIVALLGLGLLLTQSGSVYVAVQILGALYLMYLGIKLILSKKQNHDATTANGHHVLKTSTAYLEGFVTNILNPKFVLFLIAVFTQVISPEWSIVAKLYLGLLIPASALLVFTLMVFFLTHEKVRVRFSKLKYIIERVMGVALVALGLKVITSINK